MCTEWIEEHSSAAAPLANYAPNHLETYRDPQVPPILSPGPPAGVKRNYVYRLFKYCVLVDFSVDSDLMMLDIYNLHDFHATANTISQPLLIVLRPAEAFEEDPSLNIQSLNYDPDLTDNITIAEMIWEF